MMFYGTYTALVTPFCSDGSVDYGCLKEIIDRQADAGVAGIVPVGTTGESPTLSVEEHNKVIEKSVEAAAGRMQVIAGTGANCTAEAVELTKAAAAAGADATLQIAPYYNKPTPEGLYRHFSAVADIGLPVMLYNAPGRTSRDIPVSVVQRLSSHPSIVAIKEAAGDVGRVSALRSVCDIEIISGDDALTVPMISVGACGVVSVATNVFPEPVVEMVAAALSGDFAKAAKIHNTLYPLFRDLFIEVNPIPVKAAMAAAGMISEVYRLPLCEMSPDNKAKLMRTLESLGVI